MRAAVTAKKQLMVTLNWYAFGESFGSMELKWGHGRSTICGIVHRTTGALYNTYVADHIVFPSTPESVAEVMEGFEQMSDLPQCVGAIDGCFIPIKKPHGQYGSKYWCYKGMHAIILLGVVDSLGSFTYIQVGKPGCVGDAASFGDSLLHRKLEDGSWLGPEFAREIDGVMIAPFIAGDAAFPLRSYLMKNFKDDVPRESVEYAYNYCHIRARRVVENAFGRLKMRFQICRHSQLHDPKFLSVVVCVCCALHNICGRLSDATELEWLPNYHRALAEADGMLNNQAEAPYPAANNLSQNEIRMHLAEYLKRKVV
jgi:hypothetical protein